MTVSPVRPSPLTLAGFFAKSFTDNFHTVCHPTSLHGAFLFDQP